MNLISATIQPIIFHMIVPTKVLGKMKDETMSIPLTEFVGLRPKIYSPTYGPSEKRTANGVRKSVIRLKFVVQRLFISKRISHGNYGYI